MERALLTAAEVGPGYRAEPEEDDGGSAAPCEPPGTPSISERVPHQADAGRQFDHSTIEVSYTESIMIYASDDEATQAYEIFANGMDCSQGKIDDLTIAIEDPVDVSQSVLSGRTGKAQAWTLNAGTTLDGVIVVIRSGRVILLLAGLKAPSVDQKTVPDPVALAKEGFEKALRN